MRYAGIIYESTVYTLLVLLGAVIILGLHPANEGRRYKVTPFLIGLAQT